MKCFLFVWSEDYWPVVCSVLWSWLNSREGGKCLQGFTCRSVKLEVANSVVKYGCWLASIDTVDLVFTIDTSFYLQRNIHGGAEYLYLLDTLRRQISQVWSRNDSYSRETKSSPNWWQDRLSKNEDGRQGFWFAYCELGYSKVWNKSRTTLQHLSMSAKLHNFRFYYTNSFVLNGKELPVRSFLAVGCVCRKIVNRPLYSAKRSYCNEINVTKYVGAFPTFFQRWSSDMWVEKMIQCFNPNGLEKPIGLSVLAYQC